MIKKKVHLKPGSDIIDKEGKQVPVYYLGRKSKNLFVPLIALPKELRLCEWDKIRDWLVDRRQELIYPGLYDEANHCVYVTIGWEPLQSMVYTELIEWVDKNIQKESSEISKFKKRYGKYPLFCKECGKIIRDLNRTDFHDDSCMKVYNKRLDYCRRRVKDKYYYRKELREFRIYESEPKHRWLK